MTTSKSSHAGKNGRSIAENPFSTRHLLFDYLPKRIGLFVVPLGVVVALLVESPTKKLLFVLFVGVLGVVQVSNYYYCWGQHRELLEEYGDLYRSKLAAELVLAFKVG